jgi:large subunit ribosomal protein L21
MYAVIRSGGKQYRVSPGDVIRVESLSGSDSKVSFGDVLAVSGGEGQIAKPGADVHVSGEVVEQGRGEKILVFHYKRKKQYKKIFGHRQPFTAVRITEIAFDGQKFTAPEAPAKKAEKAKPRAEAAGEAHAAKKAPAKKAKPAEAKHAAEAKHKTAAKAKGKSSKGKKKQ